MNSIRELFCNGLNKSEVRPNFDETYFAIARIWQLRSTCLRTHVGACLVKDNKLISTGYNGSPRKNPHCTKDSCIKIKDGISHGDGDKFCVGVHAEANCILQANRDDIVGSTLYCTHYPCGSCARLIAQSGIKYVKYLDGYPAELTDKIFKDSGVEVQKFNIVFDK